MSVEVAIACLLSGSEDEKHLLNGLATNRTLAGRFLDVQAAGVSREVKVSCFDFGGGFGQEQAYHL